MDTTTPAGRIAAPSPWIYEGIDFRNLFWVVLSLAGMVAAIVVTAYEWPLRFIHVASGVLLTGADVRLL